MLYTRDMDQMVAVRLTDGGEMRLVARISDPEERFAWLEWANTEWILLTPSAARESALPTLTRRTPISDNSARLSRTP